MLSMKGFIIVYKAKNSHSRTLLNHLIFGRLVYRNYRGRKYAYYVPGMLHNVKFARLLPSKIFTEEEIINVECDWNYVRILGNMTFIEDERNDKKLLMQTGKEYWSKVAKEKELVLHEQRPKRKGKYT